MNLRPNNDNWGEISNVHEPNLIIDPIGAKTARIARKRQNPVADNITQVFFSLINHRSKENTMGRIIQINGELIVLPRCWKL
jgi:hypothetical protein